MNLTLPLLAAAVLLPGCITFAPQPLNPAASAAAFDARKFPLGMKRWTIDRLMDVARTMNPDIAMLRTKAASAEAERTLAGESPNPVLSFKPGINSSARGVTPWIIEPGLDIPIETDGKRDCRIAAAGARLRTARLEVERAEWKGRAEVRRTLVALYAAQQTAGQRSRPPRLH